MPIVNPSIACSQIVMTVPTLYATPANAPVTNARRPAIVWRLDFNRDGVRLRYASGPGWIPAGAA
jgi:hypothetical protein